MTQPKLFDRVEILKDDLEQNVVTGMTGTLMELGTDQTWGVVELDEDALSQAGQYCVSLALADLKVLKVTLVG